MKLTKNQIDALANKFYNDIKIELDKKQEFEKEKKLKQYKDVYNKGVKILKDNNFINCIEVNCKIGKNTHPISLYAKSTFKEFTDNYIFKHLFKDNEASIDKIKEDIILATIDSKSVDDIMKVLTNKYK